MDPHRLTDEADRKDAQGIKADAFDTVDVAILDREGEEGGLIHYRLYKRRWAGLAGVTLINLVLGLNAVWFAAVFDQTKEYFGLSTSQLNNLSNALNATLVATGLFVPILMQRFGVRYVAWAGGAVSFLAVWLRYAATHIDKGYGLLVFSHMLLGFGTVLTTTLGPKFSELWFDEKSRTTATAIYSVGGILGQLISQIMSPAFVGVASDTQFGLLMNASISTGLGLSCLLVFDSPPTPPTFTASKKTVPALRTLRMILGIDSRTADDGSSIEGRETMTLRQRFDFGIIVFAWMIIATNILQLQSFISQILGPVGISSEVAGYIGAVSIGAGIISAVCSGPLFDRVLVYQLGIALKLGTVAVLACFIGLIFAVKPNNEGGLFAVFAILGASGLSLQPFALELGSEITRSPEVNSMILQVFAAFWSVITTLIMDALVQPSGLRNGLIFLASTTALAVCAAAFLDGRQVRRERDVEMKARSDA